MKSLLNKGTKLVSTLAVLGVVILGIGVGSFVVSNMSDKTVAVNAVEDMVDPIATTNALKGDCEGARMNDKLNTSVIDDMNSQVKGVAAVRTYGNSFDDFDQAVVFNVSDNKINSMEFNLDKSVLDNDVFKAINLVSRYLPNDLSQCWEQPVVSHEGNHTKLYYETKVDSKDDLVVNIYDVDNEFNIFVF